MKEGWRYNSLMTVCRVTTGKHDANHAVESGIYRFYTCSSQYVYCDTKRYSGECLILPGNGVNVGEVYYYNGEFDAYQRTYVLSEITAQILPIFLYYHLLYSWKTVGVAKQFGSATNYIKIENFKDYYVNYPPLSEQQSIVSYLDSSFAKIDAMKVNAEKALEEAKALFQATLKEMLEPKEGWEEKKFGDVCWYNKNNGIHKDTRYIGMEHIEQGTGKLLKSINSNDVLSNTFAFNKGDVLYGRLRPYLKKVIVADFEGCCSTEIFPIQSKCIVASFLMYWFLTDSITNKVNATCAGCRMPRGNMNDVLKFDISFPPLSTQQSIVTTLDTLKSKVDSLQANYDKISQECDALKQAILRQVFE